MASSSVETLDFTHEELDNSLDSLEAKKTEDVINETRPKLRVVSDEEAGKQDKLESDADELAKVFMDILEPAEFKHNS